jgi:Zn-dependent peptidase ImmA (M78 family)
MSPQPFRAPFLTFETIQAKADQFRNRYLADVTPPFDVESVVEFDLNIRINPIRGIKDRYDIDALLLSDFSTLIVDEGEYMDERMRNRLRFSFAHELGHLCLHQRVYAACRFQNADEWLEFSQTIADSDYGWMETHANEFAGRLLVPPDLLKGELDTAWTSAQSILRATKVTKTRLADYAKDYIATAVAKQFGVSAEVIARRLDREKLWPPS